MSNNKKKLKCRLLEFEIPTYLNCIYKDCINDCTYSPYCPFFNNMYDACKLTFAEPICPVECPYRDEKICPPAIV